jgi:hypothetical protein
MMHVRAYRAAREAAKLSSGTWKRGDLTVATDVQDDSQRPSRRFCRSRPRQPRTGQFLIFRISLDARPKSLLYPPAVLSPEGYDDRL